MPGRKISKRRRASRLKELQAMPDDAKVSTEDAAILAGVGKQTVASYKAVGVIEPIPAVGMADVYVLGDVRRGMEQLSILRSRDGLPIARAGALIRARREDTGELRK